VGDDHGVIVSRGNAGHGLLAIAGLKVILPGNEEPSLRVHFRNSLPTGPPGDSERRTSAFSRDPDGEFHRAAVMVQSCPLPRHAQQWATPLKDAARRVFLVCARSPSRRDVRTIPGRVRCEPSKSRSRRLLNRKLYS